MQFLLQFLLMFLLQFLLPSQAVSHWSAFQQELLSTAKESIPSAWTAVGREPRNVDGGKVKHLVQHRGQPKDACAMQKTHYSIQFTQLHFLLQRHACKQHTTQALSRCID